MTQAKKRNVDRGLQVAWAASETLQTYALDADLRRTSNDALVTAFGHLRDAGKRAFLGMAVCVGIAQERAERGSNVLDSLAGALGKHRSRVAVLGQIYRLIIKPRMELMGARTDFGVSEQTYFETAVRFAGRNALSNASALDLLSAAEEAKLGDASFSGRAFVEAVALRPADDPNSMTSAVSKIDSIMAKLAKSWRSDAFERWAGEAANPVIWADLLDTVSADMARQAKALRKRKR